MVLGQTLQRLDAKLMIDMCEYWGIKRQWRRSSKPEGPLLEKMLITSSKINDVASELEWQTEKVESPRMRSYCVVEMGYIRKTL